MGSTHFIYMLSANIHQLEWKQERNNGYPDCFEFRILLQYISSFHEKGSSLRWGQTGVFPAVLEESCSSLLILQSLTNEQIVPPQSSLLRKVTLAQVYESFLIGVVI